MNTQIYTTKTFQTSAVETSEKEKKLLRLLQAKSEKYCNQSLSKHHNTQLSYLTKEEQAGALALPKGIILDKILQYLNSL